MSSNKDYAPVRLRKDVADRLSKINEETGIVRWKIIDDALALYEKVYLTRREVRFKEFIAQGD